MDHFFEMYDIQSGITFGDALKKLRINDEFREFIQSLTNYDAVSDAK
jgi:hypothetical protein